MPTLDPMKVGVATYARRSLSSPGEKNGLYWDAKPGEPQSPLGALVAKAQPGDGPGQGYFGYHFRLLYGQGLQPKAERTTISSTTAWSAASVSSPGP